LAQDMNSQFSASMTNVVTWQPADTPDEKLIASNTTIQVDVQVPAWVSFVPVSSIEAVGCQVMSTTLNLM